MIPFGSDTVTLYNQRRTRDANNRTVVTWYRRTLTNCSWRQSHERVQDGTAVRYTQTVTCRIPADDAYLPPEQWDATENPAAHFTLAAGDLLVYGVVTDMPGAGLSAAELVDRYRRRGAIVIGSAADYSSAGVLPHYAAKGV